MNTHTIPGENFTAAVADRVPLFLLILGVTLWDFSKVYFLVHISSLGWHQ